MYAGDEASARMRVLPSMVGVAFIRPVVAGKELTAAATERLKIARNASTTAPCSAEMALVAELRGHRRTLPLQAT